MAANPNFGQIGERLRRSTVSIFSAHRGQAGNGSGVIWTDDGLIVTNAHVVRGEQMTVQLWDGQRLPAQLLKIDPKRDVATLRVEATNLPAVATANAQDLRAGELVIAVGNPLGFHGALSTGVVHRVAPFPGMGSGMGQFSWVQADVRLAPGNSGGPLADAQGRVVGINTAIAAGLGLAVPTEAVRRFIKMGPESVSLGVTIHSTRMRIDGRAALGYVVLEVTPGSAADQASLMPGDVLIGTGVGTGESWFAQPHDLGALLESGVPSIVLRFLRGERSRWREVTVPLRQPRQEAA